MSVSGYQPMKAPQLNVRSYGPAAKWSAENIRSRASSADASEFFLGPKQTGTDWAAAFATASGNSSDEAFKDYVKRNSDKFSGGTLQAMLVQSDLVEWYTQKKKKEIEDLSVSMKKTLDETNSQTGSLLALRSQNILANLNARSSTKSTTSSTATGSTVNITV